MSPSGLGAVWAIAPLRRDHVAPHSADADSERVPALGAIVQLAVGKWAGALRSPRDLDQRSRAAVHLSTATALSTAFSAEHGEERAEQRVAADGHSVAPTALPPCPQQNAIVRLSRCVSLLHPPPIGPQNAHKWRAPRRARHMCSRLRNDQRSGDVLASTTRTPLADLFSAQLHGVQLRPRRTGGP